MDSGKQKSQGGNGEAAVVFLILLFSVPTE